MASFCLFSHLGGTPTTGGTWTYTSGPTSIQAGVCPLVSGACASPMTKNVGDTLAGNHQSCVEIVVNGTYVFTYSLSGECCSPCSSTVTIQKSALDLTVTSSSVPCTDTFSIVSPTIQNLCCSEKLNFQGTERITSSCTTISNAPFNTDIDVPMWTGWSYPFYGGIEGNTLAEITLSLTKCVNGVKVTDTKTVTIALSEYFGCSFVDAAQYIKCNIKKIIETEFAAHTAPGLPIENVHYKLDVTYTGGQIHIRFKVKNVIDESGVCCNNTPDPCIWIGPKVGAILKYRNNVFIPGDGDWQKVALSAQMYYDPNTIYYLPEVSLSGGCIDPYKITVGYKDIVDFNSSDIDHIEINPPSVWKYIVTTDPPGQLISPGPGFPYSRTCTRLQLSASSSTPGCNNESNFKWSNKPTTGKITYVAGTMGDTDECVSVKATCGSCSRCKHVIYSQNAGFKATYDGDCTCVPINSNCNNCA